MYTLYPFARPFLFALDPETAHDIAFAGLDRAAKLGVASLVAPRVPRDPVDVMGIAFPNRVGWDPLESTCRHASLSIL